MDVSCSCLEHASRLSERIRQTVYTSFAPILEITHCFIHLWNDFSNCTRCTFDVEFLHNCITIKDNLLRFYEEASHSLTTQRESHTLAEIQTQSIQPGPSTPIYHSLLTSYPQKTTPQPKTPFSLKDLSQDQLSLGKLQLREEEGIILLRQLTVDNLVKLRTMIGDLQELSEELWSQNSGQKERDHEISTLHFSIRHLLERALAILGRLD